MLGGAAVVLVVHEVEGFLQGVARGKPCGGVTPCTAVEGLVGGEDAVHTFVQQRKQRVVAQREQQGGGQGEIPCGVRGGVEREQVGEAGGGENGEVEAGGGRGVSCFFGGSKSRGSLKSGSE